MYWMNKSDFIGVYWFIGVFNRLMCYGAQAYS